MKWEMSTSKKAFFWCGPRRTTMIVSESCCGCVRFCEADDGVASSSAPLRRTGECSEDEPEGSVADQLGKSKVFYDDASAVARLMTGWRHHLHLCGEQGCELHKVSRQANPTPSLKIKKAGVLLLKLRPMPCRITLSTPARLVPMLPPAVGRARPDPVRTP